MYLLGCNKWYEVFRWLTNYFSLLEWIVSRWSIQLYISWGVHSSICLWTIISSLMSTSHMLIRAAKWASLSWKKLPCLKFVNNNFLLENHHNMFHHPHENFTLCGTKTIKYEGKATSDFPMNLMKADDEHFQQGYLLRFTE